MLAVNVLTKHFSNKREKQRKDYKRSKEMETVVNINFTECSFESTLERTLPLLRKRRNGKQLQGARRNW